MIATVYNVGTADGMNDAGLAGNVLYLAQSDFGDYKASGKPLLSVGAWLQYVLDNYATAAEAVEALSKEPFAIVAPALPNGSAATVHLAVTDKSGDTAIFEYEDGKLKVYHGRQYNVMTNEPTFDQQLAINAYWKAVGGYNFLPGTNRAADRFARMSWMVDAVPPGLRAMPQWRKSCRSSGPSPRRSACQIRRSPTSPLPAGAAWPTSTPGAISSTASTPLRCSGSIRQARPQGGGAVDEAGPVGQSHPVGRGIEGVQAR